MPPNTQDPIQRLGLLLLPSVINSNLNCHLFSTKSLHMELSISLLLNRLATRSTRFWDENICAPKLHYKANLLHLVAFTAACLIVFSRRPDAILNAQFFAEDGQRWYADAYQYGLHSLLIPDEAGGYLHTVPRLAALLSLLFPFARAPLVMNLCAIAIQVLPVTIFISSRFSNIPLWKRLLASLLYLGTPNSYGTNANATNIQWHLGLLACLVLLAQPPKSRRWKVFESIVLILISVESPMGIVLLAVAAASWWVRRNRWSRISLALLVPGAVVQTLVVVTSHARHLWPNGATLSRLISILGRQVFLASLVGESKVLHFALRYSERSSFLLEALATAVGVAVLSYALRYAPWELKLFIGFSFTVFALSLARPIAGTLAQSQWEWLRFPGTSNRYYYLPIISFLAAVFWLVNCAPRRMARFFGIALLLFVCIAIRRDWRYPAFEDMHFQEYALKFQAAPIGTRMLIPINPPGVNMVLVKR
jgi:hypothetical protein